MDDLTLIVGGRRISGWTAVKVSRGIERMPSSFHLTLTERYPGEAEGIVLRPDDPCVVLLGDDRVITGYIDRYNPTVSSSTHAIKVTGRGKCADVVDCAAEWPGSQISGASALGIAQRLVAPYGITAAGEAGPSVPQFIVMYGETAWEVIERVCRFSALLAIEQPDGNLRLENVGTEAAATGLVQGQNVEQAGAVYSSDQRYSEYVVYSMGANMYYDLGDSPMVIQRLVDEGVARHRRRAIVADSGPAGTQVAFGLKRAKWELNRRAARSRAISATVDSWRDGAGKLWTPNTRVPIELPALDVPDADWVLSEVTYSRSEQGTHADLVLMPADAFEPEPVILQPLFADVPAGIGAPPP